MLDVMLPNVNHSKNGILVGPSGNFQSKSKINLRMFKAAAFGMTSSELNSWLPAFSAKVFYDFLGKIFFE